MDLRKELKVSDLVPSLRAPNLQKQGRSRRSSRPTDARSSLSDVVGLKIGATGIAAVHVRNNGSKEVVRIAHAPLSHGVVDGGEVREPEALGKALAELFTANDLPRKNVRLGLSNSRIGVRVIEVEGIEEGPQLENAIGFRAHEMLSVPLDEAVIDHHVLSVEPGEDGSVSRRILLVVAYRDSIDRYLEATDAAGLELVGIDLEAFALLRAISEPVDPDSEEARGATIAVTIGHERTTLAISDGRVCEFARVLEWGGGDLANALARALKLAPSEGESLKQGLSLQSGAEGVETLAGARAAEALDAVRYELQSLVRELLSSLRFYQSQPGSLPIGEIVLAGGCSNIPGFASELEQELGIGVRVADPFVRVQFAEGVERPERPAALAVAVGLGIED